MTDKVDKWLSPFADKLQNKSVWDWAGLSLWSFYEQPNDPLCGDGGEKLARTMTNRQLNMTIFSGAVGASVFMGSGKALALGGPGFLILSYFIMAVFLLSVQLPLCELACVYPEGGGVYQMAHRFVHPVWGTTLAIIDTLGWVLSIPVSLMWASIILSQITGDTWSIGSLIAVCIGFVIILQFLSVQVYAEFNFWIGMLKIAVVVGVVIFGTLTLACISSHGTDGIVFSQGIRFWHMEMGNFRNGFVGLSIALTSTCSSVYGIEVVGLAAGETKDPCRSVPLAIKNSFFAVLLVYGILFTLQTFLAAADDPSINEHLDCGEFSPLAIAFLVRWPVFFRFFYISFYLIAISAAASAFYSGSRTLHKFGQNYAVTWLRRVDRAGRPTGGILIMLLFLQLSWMGMWPKVTSRFLGWYMQGSDLAVYASWLSICLANIRFRNALQTHRSRGGDFVRLHCYGWRSKLAAYMGLVSAALVCAAHFCSMMADSQGELQAKNRVFAVLPLGCLVILLCIAGIFFYLGTRNGLPVAYFARRQWWYKASELDLDKNVAVPDAVEREIMQTLAKKGSPWLRFLARSSQA